MILTEIERGDYVQLFRAEIREIAGDKVATVENRDDVIAFLKRNSDHDYELCAIEKPQLSREVSKADFSKTVVCGLVRWDSREKKLVNQPEAQSL